MKNNRITIKMGGYLDENRRIMDRSELNERINSLQDDNCKMRDLLIALEDVTRERGPQENYEINKAINEVLPHLADNHEEDTCE